MKKIVVVLLITILTLTGCSLNNESSNTNSNSNSNTNEPISTGIEYDKDKVGMHKVTMYLFHSTTCGHCRALQAWLETIKSNYPYLEIVKYEASENYDLYLKVKDKMGISEDGVPLTIIGNDYIVGYAESIQNSYVDYFKKNSTYETCDVVQTVKNNGDVETCMKKNK